MLLIISNVTDAWAYTHKDMQKREYIDKITVYKKSSYKWIKEFVSSNTEWSDDKIQERSKKLSEFYYTKILAKKISLNALKR